MSAGELIALVLFALAVDAALLIRVRRRGEPGASTPQVRLLGSYSPVLTWLKHRRLPDRMPGEDRLSIARKERARGPGLPAAQRIPRLGLPASLKALLHVKASWANPGNLAEVLTIGLVAFAYAFPLLDSHPGLGFPGTEYQSHIGPMVLIRKWLAGESEFPLWNPIIGTGRSLIADPFLFVFNPFISLPMVLLGVVNGSKAAAGLNYLLAGLGVWSLGKELKFSPAIRLWCSLLYMMSGAIPAHLTAGQIQLAFALGWLPWSIAGLLWVVHRPGWKAVALASVAQALFVFTGNLYYQMFALPCLAILSLAYTVDWKTLQLRRGVAKRVLLMGLISLGLISVQALPEVAMRPSIHNIGGFLPEETEYPGSQRPEYALLNYIVADRDFYLNTTLGKVPYLQESYRYIGYAPLLSLLLIVPAFRRGRRREIIAFGTCFLLMLAWANIRHSFVREIYQILPFFKHFRWPGRALSVGALFLILLSGLCLHHLWSRLRSAGGRWTLRSDRSAHSMSVHGYPLLAIPLGLWLALTLLRVFTANRELVVLERAIDPQVDASLAWLRAHDPGEFSVGMDLRIAEVGALQAFEQNLRTPDIIDGWRPAGAQLLIGNPEAVALQPKYRLEWAWNGEAEPGGERVDGGAEGGPQPSPYRVENQIGAILILRLEEAFPYAFHVPIERLFSNSTLLPGDVTPALRARRESYNRITVEVEARQESAVVISESWFGGWRALVDEQPTELVSVSNLLAVKVSPGHHRIVFDYSPSTFKAGTAISAFSLLLVVGLVLGGHEDTARGKREPLGDPTASEGQTRPDGDQRRDAPSASAGLLRPRGDPFTCVPGCGAPGTRRPARRPHRRPARASGLRPGAARLKSPS